MSACSRFLRKEWLPQLRNVHFHARTFSAGPQGSTIACRHCILEKGRRMQPGRQSALISRYGSATTRLPWPGDERGDLGWRWPLKREKQAHVAYRLTPQAGLMATVAYQRYLWVPV
jgi:hypothetical protein